MTNYTVLAYRSDGIDTCRGQVMGRSDSDFQFETFTDLDRAAQYWADFRYRDKKSDLEYSDYELTLLIDGVPLWDSGESLNMDELCQPHFDKLLQDSRDKEAALAAEKAQVAKLAAEQRAKEKEETDLKEYKRLQEKFGNP